MSFSASSRDFLTWTEGRWVVLDHLPDGDSLRFIPHDPQALSHRFTRLRWGKDDTCSVRLMGIDAPEIHYRVRGHRLWRQPPPWGEQAGAALLSFLGFPQISRTREGRIVAASPPACNGAMAIQRVDRYGRALALAFRGDHGVTHAPSSPLPHLWWTSANHHLLTEGWVYPLIHDDFPKPWRPIVMTATATARTLGLPLWANDHTHRGFPLDEEFESHRIIEEKHLIWPFLFRRLVRVWADRPSHSPTDWIQKLDRAVGPVTLSSSACVVPFGALLSYQRQQLQLLVPPEEIVLPR
ncbi:MAG: hypothetical protein G3H99_05890 [Ferrovum sp.]|nr:hypothetical protein [Ferrovum sp.]NDU86779.1 hypothetical protein [Ferrovum sp.]